MCIYICRYRCRCKSWSRNLAIGIDLGVYICTYIYGTDTDIHTYIHACLLTLLDDRPSWQKSLWSLRAASADGDPEALDVMRTLRYPFMHSDCDSMDCAETPRKSSQECAIRPKVAPTLSGDPKWFLVEVRTWGNLRVGPQLPDTFVVWNTINASR